jgi:two-component system, chemotaxis family, chemotaxis protein CheY
MRREKSQTMAIRVLMVDDSVFIRDVLRHHLECIGCEVVAEAENTLQALDLFRTVSPSLVTLDIEVPQTGGIGGLALMRIMRTEKPNVQVMVMGTPAFPEIRKSFMREGAVDFLVKPLNSHSFEQVRGKLIQLFPALGPTAAVDAVTAAPVGVSSRQTEG